MVEPIRAEPDEKAIHARIERVLSTGLEKRRLSTTDNAAWQIMHGIICYGQQLQVQTPDRGLTGAVEYALNEGNIRGWKLIPGDKLPSGRTGIKALFEPGSYVGQGHVDQWIGYFALAGLPPNLCVHVEGREHTLLDWEEQARWDACKNPLREFSWSLMALTHYFPEDSQWVTSDGSTWSWERMVADEVQYDLVLSPCGGMHRLIGIALALQAKRRLKLPDSLAWDEARRLVERCVNEIEMMRNADGSLSSHYLERAGSSRDLGLALASTGHMLEFLSIALDEQEITEPWVQAAAVRLCEIFEATENVDLDCGACYHGLNALRAFHRRRWR